MRPGGILDAPRPRRCPTSASCLVRPIPTIGPPARDCPASPAGASEGRFLPKVCQWYALRQCAPSASQFTGRGGLRLTSAAPFTSRDLAVCEKAIPIRGRSRAHGVRGGASITTYASQFNLAGLVPRFPARLERAHTRGTHADTNPRHHIRTTLVDPAAGRTWPEQSPRPGSLLARPPVVGRLRQSGDLPRPDRRRQLRVALRCYSSCVRE
jgi:hypothetical protein